MKAENQVCYIKYAIKLKELGFKQESYFTYRRQVINGNKEWILENPTDRDLNYAADGMHTRSEDVVSAFTAQELDYYLIAIDYYGSIRSLRIAIDFLRCRSVGSLADIRAHRLIRIIEKNKKFAN